MDNLSSLNQKDPGKITDFRTLTPKASVDQSTPNPDVSEKPVVETAPPVAELVLDAPNPELKPPIETTIPEVLEQLNVNGAAKSAKGTQVVVESGDSAVNTSKPPIDLNDAYAGVTKEGGLGGLELLVGPLEPDKK